ncbi:MAG: biotin synthase BioB [Proteobacteria bacterium]|nr:biotin synthase BioB [Pseudomonadota bacterium]MBU1709751.1 biotin synthase BioB [Pseudomonadota bacterium]
MKDFGKEIESLRKLSVAELMGRALEKKLASRGEKFSLCSIINAKSGQCSEDCKFCVQSAHYKTDISVYPLKDIEEIVLAAQEARSIGAGHFSLVTSGRGMQGAEVEKVAGIIAAIRSRVDIKVCASLGILSYDSFMVLKDAGLSRYHHNIESSREFFDTIVSTHSFDERIETIKAAQRAGLEVCAGGIIGLGETEDDRISMALTLKECKVDSVPLNILIPLPGTPLEHTARLSIEEILRAIALFRLIVGGIPVRLCAGRESALNDFLGMAFMAGADGMMIGGYLTQRGRSPEADNQLVQDMKKIWNS